MKAKEHEVMNRTYYSVMTFTRYDRSEAKKSYSNKLPSPSSEKKIRRLYQRNCCCSFM